MNRSPKIIRFLKNLLSEFTVFCIAIIVGSVLLGGVLVGIGWLIGHAMLSLKWISDKDIIGSGLMAFSGVVLLCAIIYNICRGIKWLIQEWKDA